jgi:hypothetical protein
MTHDECGYNKEKYAKIRNEEKAETRRREEEEGIQEKAVQVLPGQSGVSRLPGLSQVSEIIDRARQDNAVEDNGQLRQAPKAACSGDTQGARIGIVAVRSRIRELQIRNPKLEIRNKSETRNSYALRIRI